jgi:hypothetical protein
MTLDTSEFNYKFAELMKVKAPALMRRGLKKAGTELMEDTIMDIPSTPLLTSALRSSGAVFVDMKKVDDSTRHRMSGVVADFQAVVAEPDNKGMCADIVFNAPYAAVQHEKFPTKSYPGAGMKYMEIKLLGNADKYMTIIASEMRL